jgi:hypothetical protein
MNAHSVRSCNLALALSAYFKQADHGRVDTSPTLFTNNSAATTACACPHAVRPIRCYALRCASFVNYEWEKLAMRDRYDSRRWNLDQSRFSRKSRANIEIRFTRNAFCEISRRNDYGITLRSIGVVVDAPTRVVKYPPLIFPPQHFTMFFSSSEQLCMSPTATSRTDRRPLTSSGVEIPCSCTGRFGSSCVA